ncbi:MAG: cupin domain-containing protein [Candidatus Paceibacterota bacterium]
MKGYIKDIENETLDNVAFRKVLYTSTHSQLVVMSLVPGEDIGEEIHEDVDQFFRVEQGEGKVVLGDDTETVKDGTSVIVPQGIKHNIINTGTVPLKLYTIYMPPHHRDGVLHKTKEEAEADDEHFDGVTTD